MTDIMITIMSMQILTHVPVISGSLSQISILVVDIKVMVGFKNKFYEMALGIVEYEKLQLNTMDLNECFMWFNLVHSSDEIPAKYARLPRPTGPNSPPIQDFNVNDYLIPSTSGSLADFLSIDAPNRPNRPNRPNKDLIHYKNYNTYLSKRDIQRVGYLALIASKMQFLAFIGFYSLISKAYYS